MKYINYFEKFAGETLSSNNNTYNNYLRRHQDVNRAGVVAWENPGSQKTNFDAVLRWINPGDSLLDYGCGIGDFKGYLDDRNIPVSDYLGVDINPNFIEIAEESYPDEKFKVISNIDEINGKWDTVCAIGVFTWYITKEEFIKAINKLYESCNKSVILTLLSGKTPYSKSKLFKMSHLNKLALEKNYWKSKYRCYDKELFKELFPDLKMTFRNFNGRLFGDSNLLIKIDK